jgi:hypothetical protein
VRQRRRVEVACHVSAQRRAQVVIERRGNALAAASSPRSAACSPPRAPPRCRAPHPPRPQSQPGARQSGVSCRRGCPGSTHNGGERC